MNSEFKSRVVGAFENLKEPANSLPEDASIPIVKCGLQVGILRPITLASLEAKQDAALVTEWRNVHRDAFMTWFTATEARSKAWLENQVINRPDRILFMIEVDGESIGHIGLINFDFAEKSCELDNVVRGRAGLFPGGMTLALRALIAWSFDELMVESLFLKVFSDNQRALALYENCGFALIQQIPLRRIEQGDQTQWVEISDSGFQAERYITYMRVSSGVNLGDM